jgi:hypothetical protein
MSEAKTGFKARVEAELAAAQGENLDELKACFQQEERCAWPLRRTPNLSHSARPLTPTFAVLYRAIEHAIDHEVHTFSASVDVSYNFLSH